MSKPESVSMSKPRSSDVFPSRGDPLSINPSNGFSDVFLFVFRLPVRLLRENRETLRRCHWLVLCATVVMIFVCFGVFSWL